MSDMLPTSPPDDDEMDEDDLTALCEHYRSAVTAGRLPLLAHALSIHDTIRFLLALHNSQDAKARASAQFDLVLILVGWTPGTGEGIKKQLGLAKMMPVFYPPALFYKLRMLCVEQNIYTSPELLLDKLFDAPRLTAVLGTVLSSVEKSWTYAQMPLEERQVLSASMATARALLPDMLMLASTTLAGWRRMQPNNATDGTGPRENDPTAFKPGARHEDTAKDGYDCPLIIEHVSNVVEFNHHWADLTPVAGGAYRAVFADGSSKEGTLDGKGYACLEQIPPGEVLVYFGEDPRPYEPPPVKEIGAATFAALQQELKEFGDDLDAENIDCLIEELAERGAP